MQTGAEVLGTIGARSLEGNEKGLRLSETPKAGNRPGSMFTELPY